MPHKQKETKKPSKAPKSKTVVVEKKVEKKEVTVEDLKEGDRLEITYTANPGETPSQFSATIKRIIPKKRKPFLLDCSDGKIRQTALGNDMEWKIQTEDDRRALAEIEALRWTGEPSRLAVSQMKPFTHDVSWGCGQLYLLLSSLCRLIVLFPLPHQQGCRMRRC
jgi:hypothetical protein